MKDWNLSQLIPVVVVWLALLAFMARYVFNWREMKRMMDEVRNLTSLAAVKEAIERYRAGKQVAFPVTESMTDSGWSTLPTTAQPGTRPTWPL